MHCKAMSALAFSFIVPTVFACDSCSKNEPLNIGKLYEMHQNLNNETKADLKASQLLVFVSFSMPEQSLKAWAKQVSQTEGTLLLRGLHENSISKTIMKAKALFGEELGVDFKVDPESYQKYSIQSVPAVVVTNHEFFDMVSGDIHLQVALEEMIKKGSPQVVPMAKLFLSKIKT